MKSLIFSTGNADKFKTAFEVCSKYQINVTQSAVEIDEIQGEDPERIALTKARSAFDLLKQPVVVGDDSWVIPGLNGFPGPYMKSMNHWLQPQDFINLTQDLADRRVFLIRYLAYQDEGQTKLFSRKTEGVLLKEPKGKSEPASTEVISLAGDDGLSISEIYDKAVPKGSRDSAKIWHEFAEWFAAN